MNSSAGIHLAGSPSNSSFGLQPSLEACCSTSDSSGTSGATTSWSTGFSSSLIDSLLYFCDNVCIEHNEQFCLTILDPLACILGKPYFVPHVCPRFSAEAVGLPCGRANIYEGAKLRSTFLCFAVLLH